jgi:uncharacterized membrane-anchored protein YhcB (DUF1043 family)
MKGTRAQLTARRNSPARIRRVAAAAAMIAALGIGAMACARPGPGSAKTPDELLTQLNQDRTDIDQASQTMMKRIDMFNSSRKPGEKTLQFSEVFAADLTPDQQDVLNKMVEEEKDFSYKTLLQKIISDRDQIRDMQAKLMHLEQTLPDKFVVAKRGDRQQNLAMAYLTGEAGLDEAKAKSLLKQADQTDELIPGNKVWFFYDKDKDTFRTYVTQGDAGQTPIALRRIKQRQLAKERDTFKSERDTAQTQVASLEDTKTQLEDQRTQLENDLAFRKNSLFYHAASSKTLKDQGVLSPVLKRVVDVKGVDYEGALDLRQGTTITLYPEHYGLTGIRAVKLLPSIYQEGRDYSVETAEDSSSAKVVILDPDVFKGKEVLLAIGG